MNLSLSTSLTKDKLSANLLHPETRPTPYVHNRVTKTQRRQPRRRSQSARERIETKTHLSALAVAVADSELAFKIDRCHSHFAVLTCGRHVVGKIPSFTCEFRLCPDCARRRSRKQINKHLPIMTTFFQQHRVEPVHIVLTQKHRKETRKQSIDRLKKSFTKLQRREFWKKYFQGGIWSLEFTKGKDGLHHTHLHIIAFRSKFFDIKLLRDEWFAVTGDSRNLRLDKILDLGSGLLEVLKYISKPLDIKRFGKEDLADFLRLKNMRLFGTFGEYRKFSKSFELPDNAELPMSEFSDLVEGCPCPHCDQPLFDLRMSAGDLVQFYERIEATPTVSPPKHRKT